MAFDPRMVVRQYGDPAEEVRACRSACALFDFSFMARARLHGSGACAAIAHVTGRPLHDLAPGCIRYAVREDESGYLLSDLTIWRHADHWEVMSGRFQDIRDLVRASSESCAVDDRTEDTAILAVQGPGSLAALAQHMDVGAISKLSYFTFAEATLQNVPCIVGRLGYTGESGFELVLARADAQRTWHLLAQTVRPAGFIAADILRIEAGFVLFANEFRMPVTAKEAGLARFAGLSAKTGGQDLALVCFRARTHEGLAVWGPADPVVRPAPGMITVTSACHSIEAGGTLGLGFVLSSDIAAGAALRDPKRTFSDIRLVSLPFFDPKKRRPRATWAMPHHR